MERWREAICCANVRVPLELPPERDVTTELTVSSVGCCGSSAGPARRLFLFPFPFLFLFLVRLLLASPRANLSPAWPCLWPY